MFDAQAYKRSFDILLNDFHKLSEFVEPSDFNCKTYSFRIYELILRICTEFESLCKELLIAEGSAKSPKDMNVNDYKKLEGSLVLESIKVSLTNWSPTNDFIQPFKNWTRATPPLAWYQNYNLVKHNRNSHFRDANLENLRYSLCSLFCCLVKTDVHVEEGGSMRWIDENTVETTYKAVPFVVRRTDDEALKSLKKGTGTAWI